jgi:hypothetical protein
MKNNDRNASRPETTGVEIQPIAISPMILKLLFLAPFYNPIPRTLPIITCELETGT